MRYPDGRFAQVREAIGFIPWYFNLPDDQPRYGEAWLQAADPRGFSAPYGQTTAEQRHPAFRTHGVGKCEWDGAVWPFATSQTLTAMANYLNNYTHCTITDSPYFAELEKYAEPKPPRQALHRRIPRRADVATGSRATRSLPLLQPLDLQRPHHHRTVRRGRVPTTSWR